MLNFISQVFNQERMVLMSAWRISWSSADLIILYATQSSANSLIEEDISPISLI